jgi:hypothetical protein
MVTKLSFARRAKVRRKDFGVSRIYVSACGEFAVIESRPRGYPLVWLAVQCLANGNQAIISRHRTREGAERACEEFSG